MAVKSERIAELSAKLYGFADFENVADRGSAADLALDCKLRSVKKFRLWILKELRIVDLRHSLSVCWHFLHCVWDESFFLPKILKMSMSFTFITFTVFTTCSLQKRLQTFLSPRASSGKNKHLFTLHCNKPMPQYVFT